MINWHRLFGIFLTDYFTGTPYTVELEKDLSLQQQFLDVVILHKEAGEFDGVLPDGLDNLKTHNLLSYKSMRESFDAWAVQELIGHYVNYRKQLEGESLLSESEFSLYAISTRFPHGLQKQLNFKELKQGVYELDLSLKIRLIVLSRIEKAEHNAVWHLFSNSLDKINYGANTYHSKSNPSSVVNLLYETYQLEGLAMPYTMQDFQQQVAREHLQFLSDDEILKKFSAEDILKRFSADDVLKRFSADDVLKRFSTEEILKDVPVNERLKGLSKAEITAYLQQLDDVDDNSH